MPNWGLSHIRLLGFYLLSRHMSSDGSRGVPVRWSRLGTNGHDLSGCLSK
jgi:hypothetical protein